MATKETAILIIAVRCTYLTLF